jgi:hypothetical protein
MIAKAGGVPKPPPPPAATTATATATGSEFNRQRLAKNRRTAQRGGLSETRSREYPVIVIGKSTRDASASRMAC